MKSTQKVVGIASSVIPRSGAGRLAYEILVRVKRDFNLVLITERQSEDEEMQSDLLLLPHASMKNFILNCMRVRRASRGAAVVHALDAWPYGAYGFFAVLGTRRKLIISGVGTYSVAPLYNPKSKFFVWLAYRRANAVPCISNYTKQQIDNAISGVPTVVNFMGTTRLPDVSTEEVQAMRTRIALPEGSPVLISVGNIQDRKGQLNTVRGVFACAQEVPNLQYVVIGTDQDEYGQLLREYANEHGLADRVHIVSDIKTDRDLSACYHLAYIFALNSINDKRHFEGFGLVFLEAAQFGVPGIGSKDCGIEDAINDGVSGILTPQHDGAAIGAAIVRILKDKERFREGARAWYTRFSWDNTVKELYTLYER